MNKLEKENLLLRQIAHDLQWMARRYANGRSSYAAGLCNDHTKALLELGVKLNPGSEGTIWAEDGGGRSFDELSPEQIEPFTPEAKGEVISIPNNITLMDELKTIAPTPNKFLSLWREMNNSLKDLTEKTQQLSINGTKLDLTIEEIDKLINLVEDTTVMKSLARKIKRLKNEN